MDTIHREYLQAIHGQQQSQAGLNYGLHVFGDKLAKDQGYRSVDGIEAVYLYIINKHHWLPRDVRSMSYEDLRFVLSEELHNWTLPKEAIF